MARLNLQRGRGDTGFIRRAGLQHIGGHASKNLGLARAPYGLGRPTMSRAGWSPVGVKWWRVEMAACLIFTGLPKIISNRCGGNAGSSKRLRLSEAEWQTNGPYGPTLGVYRAQA